MIFKTGDIVINHKKKFPEAGVLTHWFGSTKDMERAFKNKLRYRVIECDDDAVKCILLGGIEGVWSVLFHPDELCYAVVKTYAKELE